MQRPVDTSCVAPILAIALLFLGTTAQGQTSVLSGKVTTADGVPLVGAEVVLLEPGTMVAIARDAADLEGRYLFPNTRRGSYELVARFLGFSEGRLAVTVLPGSATVANVQMEQSNMLLDPIVITASRSPEKVLDAPSSVTVLSTRDLQRDAVPSVTASLRNVPGVDVQQHGINHSYMSFRGFNDNYTAKVHPLLDYRDMHGPALSEAFYLLMPIQALDLARIEVVRGPGSALYGAGVDQGVVHFITKDPFAYPGTSLLLEAGQQKIMRGSFRHAGVYGGRLGYKLVGTYFRGEDWKFDPDNAHDADMLNAVADNLVNSDGQIVGPLGRRIYETYMWYLGGEARYRMGERTILTGNASYSTVKNSFNASGEWQWNPSQNAFAQIRLRSGRLFAQTFFAASLANEDYFNYRTGRIGINKSSEWGWQVQYGIDLFDGRQDFVAGLDLQRAVPRTGGSLTGRNEQNDDFSFLGAYLQSESHLTSTIDVTLSGRFDYFSATERLGFSPRGAVLFKLAPEHRVRVTYNRALGLVRGLAYYMDLVSDDAGAFIVRLRGAATPFTFPDAPHTSSFIGLPSLPTQDAGVGIELRRAYLAATAGLTADGAPLADSPADLVALLMSRAGQITGFSSGSLLLNGEIVGQPTDRDQIKPSITNTFEVGYQGVLLDRVYMGLDVYYTRKERFLGFQMITPLVLVPGLPTDLGTAISRAFSDAELSEFGLDVATLEEYYTSAGADIAANPVGVIEPIENFDPRTRPELLLVNGNFGEIDFFGVDFWLEANLTDRMSAFFNTSWVSENYFDDEALSEPGTGSRVSMNAPKTKLKLGLAYTNPRGFNAHGSLRFVPSFDVLDGFYAGTVDSYTVLDVGAGYDLSRTVSGLRIDLSALNALDNRHREYLGVPAVGRLVTARLTYSF